MEDQDMFGKLLELSQKGYFCSQILILLALEEEEKENPDLVRAMGGLCGGMGFSGGVCGCLTGGACLLGYYLCKGEDDEMEDERANEKIAQFVRWFEEEAGGKYGGTACSCILDGNPANKMTRCPGIVQHTYEKVMEILSEA
ncbi:MAG: C-GCAxxG-C-C family protein [Oscillospiraceae bacterium]|nr:C-GCAxxG-C-C family protein [Oscillospiraceae bacterium]